MFLVNCMVTFLERTKPASNIEKPAAIQKTKKPPIKNRSEFRINTESVGTATAASWAMALPAIVVATALSGKNRKFIVFPFSA